jgi:hypothetical protein
MNWNQVLSLVGFFTEWLSYLHRDIHGLFIGTLTYGNGDVTEHIRGDFYCLWS